MKKAINICPNCKHFYTTHGPRGCLAVGCGCALANKDREQISETKTIWKKRR